MSPVTKLKFFNIDTCKNLWDHAHLKIKIIGEQLCLNTLCSNSQVVVDFDVKDSISGG